MGGLAECGGRGRCVGMGVGGCNVGVVWIMKALVSVFGVGGFVISSVGVMKGRDLNRLGMGGDACSGWHKR